MMRNNYFKAGEHYVWMHAGAIAIALIMVCGLLLLIAMNGMRHFWPHPIALQELQIDGQPVRILGEVVDHDYALDGETKVPQTLFRIGNRDVYGQDFRWFADHTFTTRSFPAEAAVIERSEWGNLYGFLQRVKKGDQVVAEGADAQAIAELAQLQQRAHQLRAQIHDIEQGEMRTIHLRIEELRILRRKLDMDHALDAEAEANIAGEERGLQQVFAAQQMELAELRTQLSRDAIDVQLVDGRSISLSLDKLESLSQPNAMSLLQKWQFMAHRVGEFLSENPRESNTEGGVFPAIFGTVTMVLLMSIIVTPFGVIAAVYLHEYAAQNWFTRLIRIAVNNLAGVPSIVYGVFGLGFFVYFLGGHIDDLFFAASKPSPTFGTPGLLWSALTLALLTLPVVIVSTEEGLSRIPKAIREGSLALGATKIETLWRTVLPMASPAMMTGLILAVARAAGEVAPLMLVGVVKLTPALPVDGYAPFLHLDRKFMHLGFQIYDVGFQSPNIEAARPLVYASALLLVMVTVLLNVAAIKIRNRLREKYKSLEH